MDAEATQPMPAPTPGLEPGSQFGPFRIEARLGEGGMGVVYRAVQGLLERPVALKVMRPELENDQEFIGRFLREARAAAAVCHQNTVAIHDAGRIDGRLYLAFQFVEGGDLDALLARRGALPEAEALALAAGCCAGLQAIHEAGLLHRDLKPHNVFLDARGRPRLGDFGLARRSAGDDRLTATGAGMGTPAYMAPEQAEGVADLDIRADIHALGGTLYTLLTGHPPFAGATPWAVVQAVCTTPAPDPRQRNPAVSPAAAAIVLRAMAKRREERYAEPAAMLADLQGLIGGGSSAAVPRPPARHPALLGPFARLGWLWPLAAMAAAAGLVWPLRPLLALNPAAVPPWYDRVGLWAGVLGVGLAAAAWVWPALDRRDGGGRRAVAAVGATLPALAAGAVLVLGGTALVQGARWPAGWLAGVWLLAVAACAATAVPAWRSWWRHRPGLLVGAATRCCQALALALVLALAGHLLAVDRPERRQVDDDRDQLSRILRPDDTRTVLVHDALPSDLLAALVLVLPALATGWLAARRWDR